MSEAHSNYRHINATLYADVVTSPKVHPCNHKFWHILSVLIEIQNYNRKFLKKVGTV